jgi:hypothetical protein
MLQYQLRLHGSGIGGTRISAGILRDVLEVLTESARGALRLRVEGRSVAPGTVPQWIAAAADFDFVGLAEGSTVLLLEGRSLAESAPGLFGQGDLFQPIDPTLGSLSLVQESLHDAGTGAKDSELFDNALLDRFESLARVFARGVERIELANGRRGGRKVTLEPSGLDILRRLKRETPPNQRVRVAGWLDQIRHSDRMFTLKLQTGAVLRGVAEDVDPVKLAGLWGRKATVSGMAVFKPSGRVLRLDADEFKPASDDFSLWSVEPKPLFQVPAQPLRQPQGNRSGINAVIGQWPGDETDDQIRTALEELS